MKNMKIFVLSVVGVLLLCSVASAVEVTPFFKIACEYAANPFKAEKEWIGKEVCIEGKIYSMYRIHNDAEICLNEENPNIKKNKY